MNEDLLNKLKMLAEQYKVTKLVQFGSSLKSLEDCQDIDFACDGLYDKDFFRFGASLEELFKKPVDLIPLEPSSKFIENILKQGVVIYESTAN